MQRHRPARSRSVMKRKPVLAPVSALAVEARQAALVVVPAMAALAVLLPAGNRRAGAKSGETAELLGALDTHRPPERLAQ